MKNARRVALAMSFCGLAGLYSGHARAEAVAVKPVDPTTRACVAGAVGGMTALWVTAFITAPLTGGLSLLVPVGAKPLVIAGVAGCIAGGSGEAVAQGIEAPR